MSNLSILLKPCSGCCNLDCKYCFYKALLRNNKEITNQFISKETTIEIIKKALEYTNGTLNIVFQGGEPTLIGIDYFKFFIDQVNLQNSKNIKVNYSLQTNGILLNNEYCEFFKQNDFLIGISLDGIKIAHDKYRVDLQSKPTFEVVIEKINLLKKYGIKFNILMVVNDEVSKYPIEIYQNLKSLDVEFVQLIECLDPLSDGPYSHDFSLKSESYAEFVIKLFDEWEKDVRSGHFIHINYFENLIAILLKQRPSDCGMNGFCSPQLVIESNGDCFPCDFYVLDKWKIGNIKRNSIDDLSKSSVAKSFRELSYELDYRCSNCQYIKLCRGGCRRSRENKGKLSHTYLCEGYKLFFNKRLEKLHSLIEHLSRKSSKL